MIKYDIDFFVFCNRFCIATTKISKFWKGLKCCRKILNSEKVKVQNYEIEQNWMKLSSTFAQYH
jgi:hypothetical protein